MISLERVACLAVFQKRLGYTFQDLTLLDRALTHKSYAHEIGTHDHYERLEFLGDTVLDLIVSAYLYTKYPTSREGELSKLRARIVSTDSLAFLARSMEFGTALQLGRGEERSGGRHKNSLLAAALEAVVAAIYLDGGQCQAQVVFLCCFADALTQQLASTQGWDYKGLVQEQTLSAFGCLPTYRVVREEGPAHQKMFHVELTLSREYGCIGMGRSKKAAAQQAARQLWGLLQKDHACP
ncbi:MAG: ribonuclease III [Candidatus Tectomicrobia bacterium]